MSRTGDQFDDLLRGDIDLPGTDAPDLTESILAHVEQKRGFLPARIRAMVSASRLAIGGGLALAVLGAAALYNFDPDTFSLQQAPAPLTRVVERASSEAPVAAPRAIDAAAGVSGQVTRLVMPYLPSPSELAIASAGQGLSTLGAPDCDVAPCVPCTPCDGSAVAIRVSRCPVAEPLQAGGSSSMLIAFEGGFASDTPVYSATESEADEAAYIP